MIEVDEFRGPQTLPNFLAGDDVAGSLEKQGQKTEGLLLKSDLDAVASQLRGPQIDFVNTKPGYARLFICAGKTGVVNDLRGHSGLICK